MPERIKGGDERRSSAARAYWDRCARRRIEGRDEHQSGGSIGGGPSFVYAVWSDYIPSPCFDRCVWHRRATKRRQTERLAGNVFVEAPSVGLTAGGDCSELTVTCTSRIGVCRTDWHTICSMLAPTGETKRWTNMQASKQQDLGGLNRQCLTTFPAPK